jgi:cell division protein FtsB
VTGNRPYVVALAVLAVLLGIMLLRPFERLNVASDRVDQLEAERAELSSEVAQLEERRAALQRPEEIELLARSELGLVQPGEVPFVVVTPEPAPAPSGGEPAPADDRPWYAELWDALSRPFR